MATLTHQFTTTVVPFGQPKEVYVFDDLEEAIREWDRRTAELAVSTPSVRYEGGVEVHSFMPLKEARQTLAPRTLKGFKHTDDPDTPVCVRDGWVLHLWDGHTYLNPGLQLG